jgi:hypothetical protein
MDDRHCNFSYITKLKKKATHVLTTINYIKNKSHTCPTLISSEFSFLAFYMDLSKNVFLVDFTGPRLKDGIALQRMLWPCGWRKKNSQSHLASNWLPTFHGTASNSYGILLCNKPLRTQTLVSNMLQFQQCHRGWIVVRNK